MENEMDNLNEFEIEQRLNQEKQRARISKKQEQKGSVLTNKLIQAGVNRGSVKSKFKSWFVLIRIILSYGLDLTAWLTLFKRKPFLALGLLAGLIIFLIVILMLLIILIVRGACEIGSVLPFWSADKCTEYILK